MLAASLFQDFDKPLIIAATGGEENTVFCNLYDAATKTKIRGNGIKMQTGEALFMISNVF
ncbi:hypothetical protein [Nostoc sp. MG11]|uniref:hypothetical protein n=1 Tax=Nostoc sp. MG11 TaxID=2721166 RepID=UPI0029FECB8F|nr:hypothetical protein [Nostoc sp. MG11]